MSKKGTKFKGEMEEEREARAQTLQPGRRRALDSIKTALYERVRALKDLPLAKRRKQASYWLTALRRMFGPFRQQEVHETLYELTEERFTVESLESPTP